MRPVLLTISAPGSTTPCPMDIYHPNFTVGLGLVVSGGGSWTVQHTFDDPFQVGGPVNWFNHATINNATANMDGNYAFTVRAIRLNQNSGTGSATLYVVEAGAGM